MVVLYLLVSNDTCLVLRTLHWRRVRDTPTSTNGNGREAVRVRLGERLGDRLRQESETLLGSERHSREQTCGRVTQLHWWENVLLAKKLASSDSATGQDLPGTSGSVETPLRARATRYCSRQQETEEGVAKFVSELRRLARHCEFGAYLDEALRDRFVCGLRSEAMQKRLLTEVDLSLSKAEDIALSMEAAAKDARQLQTCSNPQATVGTVNETPEQQVDAGVTLEHATGVGRLTTGPLTAHSRPPAVISVGKWDTSKGLAS